MSAYLIDNPPHQRQFRERGTTPSGVIVVHTAESSPDWQPPDTGAEAVAEFIRNRSDFGSYHWLCDSDSIVLLVPLHLQAYGDGTGSNPHAVHVSAATQAARWDAAPEAWREDTVRNMGAAAARTARWLKAEHGVDVPARRISRDQSDQRVPGFISHGERDPGRRSDPGATFPWQLFLDSYAEALDPPDPTPNITAALKAKSEPERRKALRKVMRHGDDPAARAAERWLNGLNRREKALQVIDNARAKLRELEVK